MTERDKNSESSLQGSEGKLKFGTVFRTIFVAIISIILSQKFGNLNENGQRIRVWPIQQFRDQYKYGAPALRTQYRVFERKNFEFVNASHGDDWDILWALDYPWYFKYAQFDPLKNYTFLKHQKVNHFPEIDGLVQKAYMSYLNEDQDFILPSFILPQDQKALDKYVAKNPEKKIVEKHKNNRGVKIVDVQKLVPKVKHFYQEFMDNPFLIDGHAFDMGVFVLITSFDPIRAYRYSEEILLRFCTEKYFPFDVNNRNQYVVKDDNLHFTEMPSFTELYKKYKFSVKIMFENLFSSQGFDVEAFWKRIDRAIGIAVKNAEKDVLIGLKEMNASTHNFFELVRFDLIFDADLNPYVTEVNMSPHMTPTSKKYEENILLYEQTIFNVMKMIGGNSYHEFWSRFDSSDAIVSNYKNIATSISSCIKDDCENNCNKTSCQICRPCLTPEIRYQLREAFREHQNSANFKRVFPAADHFNDETLISSMTKKNQIQMKWFKEKCKEDKKWC